MPLTTALNPDLFGLEFLAKRAPFPRFDTWFASDHAAKRHHRQDDEGATRGVELSAALGCAAVFSPLINMDETTNITGKECERCTSKEMHDRHMEAVRDLVDSFSAIPERWVRIVAQETGAYFVGVMWGTMFLVNDAVDCDKIMDLLRDDDDGEDHGIGYEVGKTGIFAIEVDDRVVLGIDGAGYDFYQAHWLKLYNALDYRWHEHE